MAYDDQALERLVALLSELEDVPSQAASDVADRIYALIQECFDRGEGPYGGKWAPLARGGPSYLEKTGDLRGSVDVRPTAGAGVAATVGKEYGSFHITGTERMPARPFLPDGEELPPEWIEAIEAAVAAVVKRKLRK